MSQAPYLMLILLEEITLTFYIWVVMIHSRGEPGNICYTQYWTVTLGSIVTVLARVRDTKSQWHFHSWTECRKCGSKQDLHFLLRLEPQWWIPLPHPLDISIKTHHMRWGHQLEMFCMTATPVDMVQDEGTSHVSSKRRHSRPGDANSHGQYDARDASDLLLTEC